MSSPTESADSRQPIDAGRIGPLVVSVFGDRPLARTIASELDRSQPAGEPHLEVLVGPLRETMPGYIPLIFSAKTHMSFSETAYFSDEPLRYVADRLFAGDSPARLGIDDRTEQPVAAWRRRLGRTINASPAMSYGLYWYVIAALLLRNRASFLHAGVYELDGRSYAISGTGGSGKTSILFEILREGEAAFLAEDFGIVSDDGLAHFNPKAISVYSSDLHADGLNIDSYIREQAMRDRMKWIIHDRIAGTTPMVKVPVRSIVRRTGTVAPLESVIYVVRDAESMVRISEVEPEKLVERVVRVAWREHKRLAEILNLITANAPDGTAFPTVEELTDVMRGILIAAFRESGTYVAHVPARAESASVLRSLRDAYCLP